MGSFLLDTVVKPAGEAAKATSGTTQSTGLFGTWMTDHPVMLIVVYPVAKTEVFGKAEPNMSNEAPPVEEEPKKKGLFRRG